MLRAFKQDHTMSVHRFLNDSDTVFYLLPEPSIYIIRWVKCRSTGETETELYKRIFYILNEFNMNILENQYVCIEY